MASAEFGEDEPGMGVDRGEHTIARDVSDADFALLSWYVAAGADEAVSEVPVNRFLEPAPASEVTTPVAPTAAPSAPATTAATGLKTAAATAGTAAELASRASTLAELEQAIRGFDGCALRKTAMNTVFADGNPESGLMLVGEAPGADEDRLGKPFVGQSGQLLDRILAAIGRSRDSAYISNTLPWRPPGNRKPTPQETMICLPFIKRHIALVQPSLLVLLGGTAVASLLDTNKGITRLRGRWLEYDDPDAGLRIPVMPTYHPAFLLRQPQAKADVWRDFLEIEARLNTIRQSGMAQARHEDSKP